MSAQGFGFSSLRTAFMRCCALGLASRQALAVALTAFSTLPFPMVAGLERVLCSITLLACFEDLGVLAALGEDTPAMRQQAFRAKRVAVEGGCS
jgi:hypothetical protein